MVKVLHAYYTTGFGSGELYDKLIHAVIQGRDSLRYSDMLRFFEIFPEVSYIYDNTMTEELYSAFEDKIVGVLKDKKFPTEDVCRVFNVLVRISPYSPEKDTTGFLAELIGRLRHSVYDVPKEQVTFTL